MRSKAVAILDLIRLPNVLTAAADSWAGFLIAGGSIDDTAMLVRLGTASALLYAGGAALNDVCDVAEDERERPHRPIPAGHVSRRGAGGLAVALLLAGLLAAFSATRESGGVSVILAGCIVLYDAVLKSTSIGPPLMGACRGLNLLMGVHAAAGGPTAGCWLMAGLLGAYVTSLSHFARGETDPSRIVSMRWSIFGVVAAVFAVACLAVFRRDPHWTGASAALLLAAALADRGYLVAATPTPLAAQRAVAVFVLAMPLLDAAFVWQVRGATAAAVVAAWVVPSMILARRLRVA